MTSNQRMLTNPKYFKAKTESSLAKALSYCYADVPLYDNAISAVLILFTYNDKNGEISMIMNKRSQWVRQAGDLCFPGGGISMTVDTLTARFLPYWTLRRWKKRPQKKPEADVMALLLAAGLREALEEMRLFPFCVRFLGPMAPEKLVMFRKEIYPFAGWVNIQKRFYPNWEVEGVFEVPLSSLLAPENYGIYRLEIDRGDGPRTMDFDCFVVNNGRMREVLWGATYRITMRFLSIVCGYNPPESHERPVIIGSLDERYAGT